MHISVQFSLKVMRLWILSTRIIILATWLHCCIGNTLHELYLRCIQYLEKASIFVWVAHTSYPTGITILRLRSLYSRDLCTRERGGGYGKLACFKPVSGYIWGLQAKSPRGSDIHKSEHLWASLSLRNRSQHLQQACYSQVDEGESLSLSFQCVFLASRFKLGLIWSAIHSWIVVLSIVPSSLPTAAEMQKGALSTPCKP